MDMANAMMVKARAVDVVWVRASGDEV